MFKGNKRLGEEQLSNQGCLMKIVEYNNCMDIIVEFQDKYKTRMHTDYGNFIKGKAKNPYHPTVCGIGIIGVKYPSVINGKATKEYETWRDMLRRCFDKKTKSNNPCYKDVSCCKDWLLFENFYDWLHSQENFDKWCNEYRSAIDKDILLKGNKIYSPETCCLTPHYINSLFVKNNIVRGILPVGVNYYKQLNKYCASMSILENGKTKKKTIGYYDTPEKAFQAYKQFKEQHIKQLAQEEYNKGNITKRCYEAMMNYKVEIDD